MIKKLLHNLTIWVLLAIIGGICFGIYFPKEAVDFKIPFLEWKDGGIAATMKSLGDAFISIIKLFINPIIFLPIIIEGED